MIDWLTVGVLGLLLVCMIIGYCRGLMKTVVSMFSVIAAIVLTVVIAPYVSEFAKGFAPVRNFIHEPVAEMVNMVFDGNDDLKNELKENIGENSDIDEIISEIPIPDAFLKKVFEDNNITDFKDKTIKQIKKVITDNITNAIIDALCFVAVYILLWLVLLLVGFILTKTAELPILSTVNKLCGALLGAGIGLSILWVASIGLIALSNIEAVRDIIVRIEDSPILSVIYSLNPILKWIKMG